MARTRGTLYATVTEHRDGKRYERQIVRQGRSVRDAIAAAESAIAADPALGPEAYIDTWSVALHQRLNVCRRDADGWFTRDPYKSTRIDVDPATGKAAR